MSLTVDLLIGLWVILPAYFANAFAPLAGGRTPLDMGAKVGGRQVFGSGKTWKGTLFGIFIGTAVGFIEIYYQPGLTAYAATKSVALPQLGPLSVFLISTGAMIGDLVGSFMKRRWGVPRGEPVPLLDQLDFVVGAFALSYAFVELRFVPMVLIVAFTPLIHLMANLIGYKIGAKKVPW
ncbi:MAG: CDP-2,3-bis-(O-geranylgeranyl)-sn-glycerol synthase [Candidatus Aenigmatarchaeota archaeon]|nr:MAG: CDP-2,3-bis-(O-geranylgeranyl)-sn-glycerol synthase [Candidatus Aenigmarchaeota archaeon]